MQLRGERFDGQEIDFDGDVYFMPIISENRIWNDLKMDIDYPEMRRVRYIRNGDHFAFDGYE